MQPTTTRVPAVLDQLIAVARAQLPSVRTLDGPRAGQALPDDVLIIGVGNAETAEAYGVEQEPVQGLSGRPVEVITVHCELTTWSGSQDNEMSPLRTRLAGYLATLDTAFRADQQLAGTCDRVYLGARARWYGLQSPDGAGMGVEFDITARAWL